MFMIFYYDKYVITSLYFSKFNSHTCLDKVQCVTVKLLTIIHTKKIIKMCKSNIISLFADARIFNGGGGGVSFNIKD